MLKARRRPRSSTESSPFQVDERFGWRCYGRVHFFGPHVPESTNTQIIIPMMAHKPATAIRHFVFRLQIAAPSVKTQKSAASARMTWIPRGLSNPLTDIGATGIGRQGRKYRWLLNGAK